VYYRNLFLQVWPALRWAGKLFAKLGAGLSGRGRENIYAVDDADEIVRLYDGKDNPIGKCYTRHQFVRMLEPYFDVGDLWVYAFPARSLPFGLPRAIHRWLDRCFGFMICAAVRKP